MDKLIIFVDVLIAILIMVLMLGAYGAVMHFTATTTYDLIDEPVVRALADTSCPRCSKEMGRIAAEATENEVARKDAGIRMIQGGYVPSAFNAVWEVQCPHCKAELEFYVRELSLGLRRG